MTGDVARTQGDSGPIHEAGPWSSSHKGASTIDEEVPFAYSHKEFPDLRRPCTELRP
jgi:hypothetical protein